MALAPLARDAPRHLKSQGPPVIRARLVPSTPLVCVLDGNHATRPRSTQNAPGKPGIGAARLRQIIGEFFQGAAEHVHTRDPVLAAKLRRVSPHWLRRTHTSHALGAAVDLVAVRDNLWHVSIATTSTYLHGNDNRRAREGGAAFGAAASNSAP
ncbi:site-specific integrase [Paraburkholderia sp. CNPSo 3076]|nr:site-specific integrase [Paraburkholderia sp. CNPSo 3076]